MFYASWNTSTYINIRSNENILTLLTLKDFKITKKEIIDLILGAELQVYISTCNPKEEKKKISEILSRKLTYTAIKRNLAAIQELKYYYDIAKDYNKGTLKLLIMEKTIDNCYWEKIHNHYKDGKNGGLILNTIIEIKRLKKGTYL